MEFDLQLALENLAARLQDLTKKVDRLSSQVNSALQTDPEGVAVIRLAASSFSNGDGCIWGNSITIVDPNHRKDHYTSNINTTTCGLLKTELLALWMALDQLLMYQLPSRTLQIVCPSNWIEHLGEDNIQQILSEHPECAELGMDLVHRLQAYHVLFRNGPADHDPGHLKLAQRVTREKHRIEEQRCSQPAESESSPMTPRLMSTNPQED